MATIRRNSKRWFNCCSNVLVSLLVLLALVAVSESSNANHSALSGKVVVTEVQKLSATPKVDPSPRARRGYKVKGYFYPVSTYKIKPKHAKRHQHVSSPSSALQQSAAKPHLVELVDYSDYQHHPIAEHHTGTPEHHHYHHHHKKSLKTGLLIAALPFILFPLLSMLYAPLMLQPAATGGLIGRRRRKRSPEDEDDLHKLRPYQVRPSVIANYLRKIHYDERARNRAMSNYLRCEGMLGPKNHCFERLACEFTDIRNRNARGIDKAVTSILLGHVLKNEFIPASFKKRLKAAAVYGKRHSGKCGRYACDKIKERVY